MTGRPALISPDPVAAAVALRAGQVVAIPTDTVYGLAVDPRVAGATAALFVVKARPTDVALPVLVPDLAVARRLADPFPAAATALAGHFWPGPLTIVVARSEGESAVWDLGGDGATVGLRCPAGDAALELLRLAGPLVVTSANRHGAAPLTEAAAVAEEFGDEVAMVLDGGKCAGVPSTVVLVTRSSRPASGAVLRVARRGPIGIRELRRVADRPPAGDGALGTLGPGRPVAAAARDDLPRQRATPPRAATQRSSD